MNSKFNGGLLGYIGTGLLMFVIIVFSLGLATPWAICIGARWYARHSTIDGRQVVFDGKGWQLFGNFVKWLLLSVITLFIFSLWIPIKMAKWVVKHIHLEPEEEPIVAPTPAPIQQPAPAQRALTQCPDCGQLVSLKARQCVHCGAPLVAAAPVAPVAPIAPAAPVDTSLTIKFGEGTRISKAKNSKIKYVVTDDATGETLATASHNETVTLNISKPATIRCHLGKGIKDAVLDYVPTEGASYRVVSVDKFFGAPHLEFQALENLD